MTYAQSLFDRFQPKGLLLDANLQLLHLVGTYNRSLIGDGKYNKLSKYTLEDFELVVRLKSIFRRAVTTPHVLTEVSNLTGDLPQQLREACFDQFARAFSDLEELSLPSFEVAHRPQFRFLGLTDTGLAELCRSFLVVSDDARMIGHLNQSGLEALNFNHLRQHLFQLKKRDAFSASITLNGAQVLF